MISAKNMEIFYEQKDFILNTSLLQSGIKFVCSSDRGVNGQNPGGKYLVRNVLDHLQTVQVQRFLYKILILIFQCLKHRLNSYFKF